MGDFSQEFEDRFKVEEVQVDQGGRPRVYLIAEDQTLNTTVFIKVMLSLTEQHDTVREMFEREILALQTLKHENIVKLITGEETDYRDHKAFAVVLEHIEAPTLERLIRKNIQPLPLPIRIECLIQVCNAVIFAHQHNIIHRDITPANIFYDHEKKQAKLADFGISKIRSRVGAEITTVHSYHTRPYAAPEQSESYPTRAVDVHAFAVVMATVLAWKIPEDSFKAGNVPEWLDAAKEQLRTDTFEDTLGLIALAMDPLPDRRPQMQDLLELLRKIQNECKEKIVLEVELRRGVRKTIEEISTVAAFVRDFDQGMRARYRADPENESFYIQVYGRSWKANLRPTLEQGVLYVSNAMQLPAQDFEQERNRAHVVNYGLNTAAQGQGGDCQVFIDELEKLHAQEERQKADQAARQAFLETAIKVSDLEFLLMNGVKATTKLEKKRGVRKGLTGSIVCSFPKMEPNAVAPIDPEVGKAVPKQALEKSIAVGHLVYNTSKAGPPRVVGEITNWKEGARTATIKLKYRNAKLDKEVLVMPGPESQQAQQTRQVLDRFIQGHYINPDLAFHLLQAEKNEVVHPSHMQPIIPALRSSTSSSTHTDPQRICAHARAANSFYLVQGPPGTGKTTLIAEVVGELLSRNPDAKILITSQGNEAVRNALERIKEALPHIQTHWVMSGTQEERIENQDSKEAMQVWGSELVQKAQQAQNNYVPVSDEKTELVQTALQEWNNNLRRNGLLRHYYVRSTGVYGVTSGSFYKLLSQTQLQKFDHVIIDEAAKSTYAETLLPLLYGERYMLVGDQKQLPPYLDRVLTKHLTHMGLDAEQVRRSLFEDLFDRLPSRNRVTLDTQHRMHPSIGQLVGDVFYSETGGLRPGRTKHDPRFDMPIPRFDLDHRFFWVDVFKPGTQLWRKASSGDSSVNEKEVEVIVQLLKQMNQDLQVADKKLGVKIISPYKAQAALIQSRLEGLRAHLTHLKIPPANIGTVDSFQGKEDDVVICSFVKFSRNPENDRAFAADEKRLNVTLSRAVRLLIGVGDYRKAQLEIPEVVKEKMLPKRNIIQGDSL